MAADGAVQWRCGIISDLTYSRVLCCHLRSQWMITVQSVDSRTTCIVFVKSIRMCA